ncbi:MAG TPA: site-2 protease family protein [Thermoleophilaceae bacterium]|nr:site-2 protease family protein [Thermoleophilaceae bacterium]
MFGGGSIQLARVFGIRIGVDYSWFIVLFLIIWNLLTYYDDVAPGSNAFVLAVISALLFFLSILLHELGHAWVAIRNGIPIEGIDLWMFGGVAKLGKDADSPGVEFRVAAAGPLVTMLIALVCFGLGAGVSSGSDALHSAQFDQNVTGATTAVLGYLTSINVLLLGFNLIPAFPLDGGRIARAIAWRMTGDRNKATRFAARLGRLGGYLMIAAGVALYATTGNLVSSIWLAFIGWFLAGAARSAEAHADFAGRIEHIRVTDVMDHEPVAIPEGASLSDAEHDFFLRYGWPWFPVTDTSGRLVGVVSREAVESIPPDSRDGQQVASVMARDDGSSGLRVRLDEPLENLLGQEGLARLGAIMAVDGEGVLRGVVTIDAVRRALQGAVPA